MGFYHAVVDALTPEAGERTAPSGPKLQLGGMQWLRRGSSQDVVADKPSTSGRDRPGQDINQTRANLEKMSAYHDLAKVCCCCVSTSVKWLGAEALLKLKDTLERAYAADVEGQHPKAARLYKMALSVCAEGLALHTPSAGLGPQYSNSGRWAENMKAWQRAAQDRYALCPAAKLRSFVICTTCHLMLQIG